MLTRGTLGMPVRLMNSLLAHPWTWDMGEYYFKHEEEGMNLPTSFFCTA